eukprot:jgi/Botrbrau1/12351/Bobra.0239s0003.1
MSAKCQELGSMSCQKEAKLDKSYVIRRQAPLALPARKRLVKVVESVARPYAHGWLLGLPVERMGQVIANIEFRCRLRPVPVADPHVREFPGGASCSRCGQEMDRWGDHAVQCRLGRGVAVTFRHNAVRDVLFRIGKEVEAVVTREPPHTGGLAKTAARGGFPPVHIRDNRGFRYGGGGALEAAPRPR